MNFESYINRNTNKKPSVPVGDEASAFAQQKPRNLQSPIPSIDVKQKANPACAGNELSLGIQTLILSVNIQK